MSVAASIQLSSMFAQKKHTRASRVIADLLRVCLLIGILVPAVLLPVSKPLMRWLAPDESSEENIHEGFTYLAIMFGGAFVTCVYYLLCGCLETEGRTVWYNCIQLMSTTLNQGIFNPIFIVVLKMGIP
jgi:Na+-driven multidrug efflux pump